jgi:hypothetical protein
MTPSPPHKHIWNYLRKFTLSLGGRIEYIHPPRVNVRYQRAEKNPFDQDFAVAWKDKVIYCPYRPQSWPRLLHEMAHVFGTNVRPHDLGNDEILLSWEFAALELIGQNLCIPRQSLLHMWVEEYGPREVDFEHDAIYYVDFDELYHNGSTAAIEAFYALQLSIAQQRGTLTPDNQLTSLRYD